MLKGGVSGEDGVVRLDDRVRGLRGRVHGELKLRLLAVVGGEALKQKRTETRAGSTTERVEDEEALKTRAVVCQAADLVHHNVNLLLTDGVVATRI